MDRMAVYDALMAPLEKSILAGIRRKIIPSAFGKVLEIGYGTGVNFQFYDFASVKDLTILEVNPSEDMEKKVGRPVHQFKGRAENLPFDKESFDTVVETLVLCSVENVNASVEEVIRVLKPGGRFIFMDHVLPEKKVLSSLFSAADIVWPKIMGGCHLGRRPDKAIEAAGFIAEQSGEAGNSVFRWGIARKPAVFFS